MCPAGDALPQFFFPPFICSAEGLLVAIDKVTGQVEAHHRVIHTEAIHNDSHTSSCACVFVCAPFMPQCIITH